MPNSPFSVPSSRSRRASLSSRSNDRVAARTIESRASGLTPNDAPRDALDRSIDRRPLQSLASSSRSSSSSSSSSSRRRPTASARRDGCARASYFHTYIALCRVLYETRVLHHEMEGESSSVRIGKGIDPSTCVLYERWTSTTRPRRLASRHSSSALGLDRSIDRLDRWWSVARSVVSFHSFDAALVRRRCARVRSRRRSRARRR